MHEDDDDYSFDEDEEEDSDNIFIQSSIYTHEATVDFLKSLILKFEEYQIPPADLPVISKMFMVVKEPRRYRVSGYLSLTVKEIESEGNFRFQEIQIDSDGLQLTTGGYETEEDNPGGDSYSTVVFPCDDENEALDTISIVDSFFSDLEDKINLLSRELEAIDSGDEIEDLL